MNDCPQESCQTFWYSFRHVQCHLWIGELLLGWHWDCTSLRSTLNTIRFERTTDEGAGIVHQSKTPTVSLDVNLGLRWTSSYRSSLPSTSDNSWQITMTLWLSNLRRRVNYLQSSVHDKLFQAALFLLFTKYMYRAYYNLSDITSTIQGHTTHTSCANTVTVWHNNAFSRWNQFSLKSTMQNPKPDQASLNYYLKISVTDTIMRKLLLPPPPTSLP